MRLDQRVTAAIKRTSLMLHCTADGLRLSGLRRRVVEATFDGVAITLDGGALLLREAERRTGLLEQLSRELVD